MFRSSRIGIAVSPQGEVCFADAARRVLKITNDRKLLRVSADYEHWMVIDPLSSGVPIAIDETGNLFYAPYTREGSLEIAKRERNEQSVLAHIELDADGGALQWVNGISSADGTVYFTENAAV